MLLEDAGGGLVTSGSILSPRKKQQLELEEVDDKLITIIPDACQQGLHTIRYELCVLHISPDPGAIQFDPRIGFGLRFDERVS